MATQPHRLPLQLLQIAEENVNNSRDDVEWVIGIGVVARRRREKMELSLDDVAAAIDDLTVDDLMNQELGLACIQDKLFPLAEVLEFEHPKVHSDHVLAMLFVADNFLEENPD